MKRNILFLLSLCMLLLTCSDGNDPIKEIENKDPFITLKKSNIDFTNDGGSEAILIESNVTWTAKSSASWCTVSPSSGNKSTASITLSAPANEDYDNRSCTVTIESGGISKTITVNQGENLGLLITQDRYELGNEESTIKVEVKANVDFEVEINDEWISKIETRGLTTSEMEFKIAKNDTYDNRDGSITIKQKGGNLSSTIKVYQSQEDALILSEKNFNLSSEAQSVEVEIKTNIDFEIIIPEEAKEWVSHATTRALRTETVVLDVAENKEYDERTVEVIVKDKKTDLEETVTIKQAANTGLIISEDKYELTNDGGTIEVEVKANVEFDIEIADKWITRVETRGLTKTKLQFHVAKNENYDSREGTITIKQKDGNLSSTIKVYQSQKDAIILSDKTFDLTSASQSIDVELKTNVEFQVIIPEAAKSWVSHTPTRGLRTETLTLNIAENKDYDGRSTEIYVKDKKTNLQDTLTINQAANTGLIVSEDKYELSNDGGTFNVEVKANIDYKVTISDNWITQIKTRGLTTTNLTFTVAKNESYNNREGSITISQTNGDLSSTITVYQSQENAIILSEKEVEVSDRSQTLDVVIKTNIDFDVTIKEDGKDWVSYTPTRGLREETISLNISENHTDRTRSTEVYIKDKATNLQETLIINQTGKEPGVYYVERMGTLGSMLSQTQKDTITTMIVKGEINKADFDVMKKQMPKLKYLDLKDVKCEDDKIPYRALGGTYDPSNDTSNKNITTIILPHSVTSIGEDAFLSCTGLTGSLVLPTGLTTIGRDAFSDCPNLTGTLNLPDGLKTIEDYAFFNCSGFTGPLKLPAGLTKIGAGAFMYCFGFNGSLTLPADLTVIEHSAFWGCSGLSGSLNLPEGLTTIGRGAFLACKGFTGSLILPDGLINIEDVAFSECRGFTGTLIIPNVQTTIGANVFEKCTGFTDFKLPAGLEKIPTGLFSGCTGLTGILNLPDELTTVGYNSFAGCTGLTGSLNIPLGVTTIEGNAFKNCTGFTGSLILPDGLTTIGASAFEDCTGFTGSLNLPEKLTTIEQAAFAGCTGLSGSLNLPDGLKIVQDWAFYNCINLSGKLILPKNLTFIGESAFSDCIGFTGSLNIPPGVTTLKGRAFQNCTGFTGSLILPDGLTTIGERAFQYCRGLTEVILGKSLTTIYDEAFYGCSSISEKIIFPKSLISTRKESFYECNKVEVFQFPHTTPLGYYPNMLPSNATVEVPAEAVETYKSTNGWKDYNIVGY